MIQPLAIQRERRRRPCKPARRLCDVIGCDTTNRRCSLRRIFTHRLFECVEALGVCGDVGLVGQLLPQHHMQHGVKERDIGAGQYGQKQIGSFRGIGTPRINNDDFQVRPRLLGRLDPTK